LDEVDESLAISGFILYLLEMVDKIIRQIYQGKEIGIGIALFVLLLFINSIRGTFAYHKMIKK